ncbi:LADA_0H02520g1_1 [Lachancea dasiensis]|uniref:LADA_0H02520g1_1 n=1 Tax=Lachancea dasiensis TaxID=1072105 RepID=A0A1G4JZT7_9SACH|nr:LADA_0H02520g1_1 [Lachancea dasiensis]
MDLNPIFAKHLDLYEILKFSVQVPEDVTAIGAIQIKRNFRQQALKYHPDKNPNNPAAISTFHLLEVASNLLSNPDSKNKYDQWYIQTFLRQRNLDLQREQQRQKLYNREQATSPQTNRTYDTTDHEKYGQLLRKLKHFKIPYGDWQHFDKSPRHPLGRLRDSCTLRLELSNSRKSQDKNLLMDSLSYAFQTKVTKVYYSSRNDYKNDNIIVAYATFDTIQDTLRILQEWNSCLEPGHADSTRRSGIEGVSPKVSPSIFTYRATTELRPEIQDALTNRTIVIE